MCEITADRHDETSYQIRIQGHLSCRWTSCFEGMALSTDADADADGATVLEGPVIDQAALHGLLSKLRDIGLPLLSVRQVPSGTQRPSAGPSAPSPTSTTSRTPGD